MNAEAIVPSIMFITLGTVLILFFWFRYRMRGEMQQTIRAAIDKGQELSPEIVDRLGQPRPRKDRDLRWAIITVAVSVALVIFGSMIPDDEAQQVFVGIAAFPFCVGIAFFILHFFSGRD